MSQLAVADGHVAYWQQGSGPALIFIHGVGTPGRVWSEDLAELTADATVVTYDRRGYGASSASPRDWSAHARDAIALIEGLDAAPARVVGFSGGAIAALDVALQRPELVSELILLDPAVFTRSHMTPAFLWTFLTVQALHRLGRDRTAAERWFRYTWSRAGDGSSWPRAAPERRELLLDDASGLFADLASGDGSHLDAARLRDLVPPVTIIEAALSPPFLRRSVGRLRELIPQARLMTLEHAGHAVAVDDRAAVLALLRS